MTDETEDEDAFELCSRCNGAGCPMCGNVGGFYPDKSEEPDDDEGDWWEKDDDF